MAATEPNKILAVTCTKFGLKKCLLSFKFKLINRYLNASDVLIATRRSTAVVIEGLLVIVVVSSGRSGCACVIGAVTTATDTELSGT